MDRHPSPSRSRPPAERTSPPSLGAEAAPGSRAAGSESFGRSDRILARADFKETYQSGRKTVGRCLVFFVRPNGRAGPRIGITVTKKCGGAVVRNRVRRRVRELYRRRFRPVLAAAGGGGLDLVVNVRPEGAAAALETLSVDFDRLLSRLKGTR